MRKKLLLGNWKMNKTPEETKLFCEGVGPVLQLAITHDIDLGIAPSFICLETAIKTSPKGLIVSAQNCSQYEKGAYTGEVSIPMLEAIGVSWVILGHSERREYNNETSSACNEKIKALLAKGMTPVYCCGESLATYEKGETKSWVKTQIEEGLKGLTPEQAKHVVIAYEPIWAIGTGKSASKEIAEDTIGFIRRTLKDLFGIAAMDMRILYGGSVKPENIASYMSEEDIDGALVGGASLAPDSFKALVENLVK